MLAASSTELRFWSEVLVAVLISYNSTNHTVTGFPPAVVLYSWICNGLDSVPQSYRKLVEKHLKEYTSWESMRLIINETVKVAL